MFYPFGSKRASLEDHTRTRLEIGEKQSKQSEFNGEETERRKVNDSLLPG